MSITSTDPIIEAPENNRSHGFAPSPKQSGRRIALWGILSLIAVAIVGVVALALGGLFLARGSAVSVSEPAGVMNEAAVPETTIAKGTVQAPAIVTFENQSDLLLAFGGAWTAGDFESMSAYANDAVIATAQEWHDGGSAAITSDNVDDIVAGCTDAGSCQFLYAPPDGFGLIFDATITETDTGLMISDLQFGGDAG